MAARVDIPTLIREVNEVHEHFPTWTLDNAFVHWFLQAFLVPDAETAARSVTGVSHDKGCDGVYIDESLNPAVLDQGGYSLFLLLIMILTVVVGLRIGKAISNWTDE